MWITNYLGVLGSHLEVAYDAYGELVDSAGNYFETDGTGSVYNSFGEYVGTLYTSGGDFIEETRDQLIDAGRDASIAAAIAGGVALMFGFWLVYKVVK